MMKAVPFGTRLMNPNDRIGPYTLQSPLGDPARQAWLASAARGKSRVVLHLSRAGDKARRSLLMHAVKLAGHFDHPNIVRMHECGEVHELIWVASAYVGGEGALSLTNFRQLLLALLHVHGNDVVHGDIRPGNLLIESEGDLRLSDFRHARKVGQAASQEGGRSPYASPEQHLGDVLDTRADIYAAGAVLYELLTRKRHVGAAPVAPSVLAPALGSSFDAVIARALAPEKAGRFAHVFEFLAAYDAACQRGLRSAPAPA